MKLMMYSLKLRTKAKQNPNIRNGRTTGMITVRYTLDLDAPQILAASIRFLSTESSPMSIMTMGRVTRNTPWLMTAAYI